MRSFLDEVRKAVRIRSVGSEGTEEIANYFSYLMEDLGLKTQLIKVTHSVDLFSRKQYNCVGILGDPLVERKLKRGLLLLNHFDTALPGQHQHWTETEENPWNSVVKNDVLYGIGSADGRADFMAKLFAMQKFREKKLKTPIYLVGTCGQKTGMLGAKYLIQSLSLNPSHVVVGAPTGLKFITQQKSLSIHKTSIRYVTVDRDSKGFNRKVYIKAFGKVGSSAFPDSGDNALLILARSLHHLMENGFELQFTGLSGGELYPQVPDTASAEFYLTSHQFEDFKRFFVKWVRAEGKEKQFQIEMGAVGDTGISFLPQSVFSSLIEILFFIGDLGIRVRNNWNEQFDPPYSTLTPIMIRQLPSQLDVYFDVREVSTAPELSVSAQLQEGLKAIASRYAHLNFGFSKEQDLPGFSMSPEHPWLKTCLEVAQKSGIRPVVGANSVCSEAGLFAQKGFDTVVFGPGIDKSNSHSPNEHIDLEEVQKAMHFYEGLIEKICL